MNNTFSSRIKSEMSIYGLTPSQKRGMLLAIFQIASALKATNYGLTLEIINKNENAKDIIVSLLKELYDIDANVILAKEKKLNKDDYYIIQVLAKATQLLNELSIIKARSDSSYQLLKELDEDERLGYIRGAFLSTGSVNDPHSSTYHLEIQTFNMNVANNLRDLLNQYYLNAKTSKNRRGYFVYLKCAEHISDLIKLLDTNDSLFYFENIRIERDLSNSINRVINCEISNMKKALVAAERQLDEIKFLEAHGYEPKKHMKNIIELRKTYPEDSLTELSNKSYDLLGINYTRSVINHKLREIHEEYVALTNN